MPTEVIHTVGSGKDYATLQAWNSAQARNLVSADEIAVAECYGGTDLLGGSFFNASGSWTTDSTRYCVIRAAEGEQIVGGSWDTSKAYGTSSTPTWPAIYTGAKHFEIVGMQIKNNTAARVFGSLNMLGVGQVWARSCLFVSGNTSSGQPVVDIEYAGGSCSIENCTILFNGSHNYFIGITFRATSSITHYLYNNTIVGIVNGSPGVHWGIYAVDAVVTVESNNNYFQCNSISSGSGTVNLGANDAHSGTGVPTASLDSIPYDGTTFVSVTTGSEDLTPVSGSPLIDAGADLSGSGITDDMNGTTRPQGSSYDIGAIEILSSGTLAKAAMHYYRMASR